MICGSLFSRHLVLKLKITTSHRHFEVSLNSRVWIRPGVRHCSVCVRQIKGDEVLLFIVDSVTSTARVLSESVVSLIWSSRSCMFTNRPEVTNTQVKVAENVLSVLLLIIMIKANAKISRLPASEKSLTFFR